MAEGTAAAGAAGAGTAAGGTVGPSHRVACHWVHEIASGALRPHEVEAELVRPSSDVDVSLGPDLLVP